MVKQDNIKNIEFLRASVECTSVKPPQNLMYQAGLSISIKFLQIKSLNILHYDCGLPGLRQKNLVFWFGMILSVVFVR